VPSGPTPNARLRHRLRTVSGRCPSGDVCRVALSLLILTLIKLVLYVSTFHASRVPAMGTDYHYRSISSEKGAQRRAQMQVLLPRPFVIPMSAAITRLFLSKHRSSTSILAFHASIISTVLPTHPFPLHSLPSPSTSEGGSRSSAKRSTTSSRSLPRVARRLLLTPLIFAPRVPCPNAQCRVAPIRAQCARTRRN
jgi:hypothetical protein